MATSFDVFYLGNVADIDPTEGDITADNANSLVGSTFGSTGDPLYSHIKTLTPGSTGFSGGPNDWGYDTDNNAANDTYSLDGGPDQTHDSSTVYAADITYTDGTTATIAAVVFQDTAGNLYLAPKTSYDSDQAALEAKPIESLQLFAILSDTGVLTASRYAASYAVCFTSGTLIRTPKGDVQIEHLRESDLVTTLDNGPQPVRWIGRQSYGRSDLHVMPRLRPVLIPRGRMGNGRDLLVSQQHGLMLGEDQLIRAIHAARAPRSGIRVAHGKRSVTYFHLMFDAHQIIFSEGAPSESFYPGPMAQRMLATKARQEIGQMFPCLFDAPALGVGTANTYGPTARTFLGPKNLEAAFANASGRLRRADDLRRWANGSAWKA